MAIPSATTKGESINGQNTAPYLPGSKGPKPIAICGMACRLPSGIKTPQGLWEFLLAGNDARSKVPKSRYNVEAFYDPNGKPGTTITQHGYFLDDDLTKLDTSFFSMPRKEMERMDPQQRLMLEVVRECFEDGGEVGWRGKKIGCYVGNLGDDWLEMLTKDSQSFGIYRLSGYGDYTMSNRISYEMNLQGPSMTIRTACSASLVALHEACVAIERGDCVSAIVGGTNLILNPGCTTLMSEQGVLSPDGSCKTFSSAADGYARGEAIVGVFLKPLDEAIRNGNPIRAVIRATATNHDGKTSGFSLPSSDAQEAMIRRAYEVAGLPVSDTGYVECHGTGTFVGDPIETKALSSVFGELGVTIGSTKPNFGHTEGASGILSLLKAILMLENRVIPPSIKCSPRNPNIPWVSGKLVLAEEPLSWPQGRLERVSVNSFGLGGTNAHVIVDSAASCRTPLEPRAEESSSQLLLYSANTQQSLTTLIDDYGAFIRDSEPNIDNVAYTLARGREHLSYRSFAIANGSSVGVAAPITKPSQQKPKIVMVFTGQGSQWPEMGSALIKSNPTFRSSIHSLVKYLTDTLGEEAPNWNIEEELLKTGKKSRLGLAEFAQPLCTAIQVALIDSLRAVGIEADAVVGHSSGELAGAYAAGALSSGEAIVAAQYRGIVASLQERPGAMAAVGLGISEAKKFLVPNTSIACDNSPRSVTISGDADGVDEVLASIQAAHPDTLARKLKVDKAYHSYHMAEIGDIYRSSIEHRVAGQSPKRPFFSSVEGKLLDSSASLGPRYWQKNLESPVLFNGAVEALLHHYSHQDIVLLEVGPHSALAGPLTQIMSEVSNNARYIPTMVRNQNSVDTFLSAVGKLYASGVPIDLQSLFSQGSCLSDLPRYPFSHDEGGHWFESRLSKEFRQKEYAHHDILGSRVVESTDIEPSWRNVLHVGYNTTWMKDHKVGDDIVFPFAGYVTMVGEAIRQVTKKDDAFRVRHISVGITMLLSEESPTEIITTLRPLRLTISQDSSWYEFTISAHNGRHWTKHCSGEVKAEGRTRSSGTSSGPFPRAVRCDRWFGALRRAGLDLGHHFQNIDGITASTTSQKARGTVSSKKYPVNPRSKYHVHPTVLDSALQLLSVASSNGLARRHRNFLPVFCNELFVACTTEDFVVDVEISSTGSASSFSRIGQGKGVLNGQIVFQFDGLELASASITNDSAKTSDVHAASRLTWAPDIRFVDLRTLFTASPSRHEYDHALGELGKLVTIEIQKRLACISSQRPHLEKYAQWIRTRAQLLHTTCCNDEQRLQKMEQLREILASTPAAPAAEALDAVASNVESLFNGTVSSWELLAPADTVAEFYSFISEFPSSEFFRTLGHSNPNLRVLELGNWTRSPMTAVLQALTTPNGHNLWSQYTFATKNLVPSEERLTNYVNLEYAILDIGEDPADQGFEYHQYDIVIANNAIHATPNLAQSLQNIHKLLDPAGFLFLQELASTSKWINNILGTTPAWWRGVADNRADEPFVDASRWLEELKGAGFGAPDLVALNSEESSRINGVIITRPYAAASAPTSKHVSLLVRDRTKNYDVVESILQAQDYEVTKITLKDVPQPNVEIISILDLDDPFFDNIANESYYDFQKFLANLDNSGIFWVTKPCHIRVQDPRYAQVIGLARVLRYELLLDFATCEADNVDGSFSLIVQAFEKFLTRDNEGALSPDFEYAIDKGLLYTSRYFPFVMMEGFMQETQGEHMKVAIGTPGRLNTLHWVRQPEPACLKNRELEIELHAVGVNFKDVLVGMNLIEQSGRFFGLEGAGVVRRVGPDVRNLKPGDRVATMEHNVLSTLLLTSEAMCVKIPDSLSFTDAATMFTVYATVQQSLITVGQLEKGQSLLIHSACGGVGLAAVQIARMIGAEIYATVGSEEKVQYLVDNWNIPRNRIFNSRDNSFVEGVYRETNGKGIDQVLNSLSGELLHETWKCVAPHGKLIEIGKRGLVGHGRLDMKPFVANRSYCCVDIDAFYDATMSRFMEVMKETLEYLEKGLIKPIPIAKEFDASSIAEAFRYLLPGTHIGRVAIRIRDSEGLPTLRGEVRSPLKKLQLDPDGSYLLTGGLGGLGRAISTYMVEHGARNLIYLSRRAGQSDADQSFIGELKSMGVSAITVRGDINDLDDVSRAVAEARAPLRGVLQMAATQADENFAKLTKEQWDYSVNPKVTGTWNLHHATAHIDLDFFVLFSSMSAVVGLPGQANYASGNSFLDAFVQYRNSLGLVCSAVQIGPVADVGFLAERTSLLQTATLTGFKTLHEQEMLDSIALSMMATVPERFEAGSTFIDPNVFVLGLESAMPLSSPANRTVWKRDRRMAVYHNDSRSAVDDTSSPAQLKGYIANARADPSILETSESASYFAQEVGKRLFGLLLKDERDLNTSLALADLGLDSLVAIELRAWCKQAFGFDISVLEMLSMGNLEALGGHVAQKMLQTIEEERQNE
ncbi:t1pks [Metarhizium rileyi]|uniref:T1pks n=1 Tax=Metarhizium rileyi (strain RCEF 4871) TaxID=1649241 RepID=A0A5C6GL23_METRR|nr:t1pks [Metarhizium rileyi]